MLGPCRAVGFDFGGDVQPGELLAVVGEVGPGKSSLLAALLGELMPMRGPDGAVHGECCGKLLLLVTMHAGAIVQWAHLFWGDVQPGELLAVVGEVGAGKSSLLAALLGELMPMRGPDGAVYGECVAASIHCFCMLHVEAMPCGGF
jgi:ABC-type hemin transport system ATPase subunit